MKVLNAYYSCPRLAVCLGSRVGNNAFDIATNVLLMLLCFVLKGNRVKENFNVFFLVLKNT